MPSLKASEAVWRALAYFPSSEAACYMTSEPASRRVLFFGDSLVAGVGDPAGGGWVARLLSASFKQGMPLTAYNLGVRGETSVQVATRWRAEALLRIPAGAEARVVVSFGANDTTIEDGAVRVATEGSCRALAAILDEADALGFPAFVIGPAPVDDAEQNLRISALSRSFAEVCQERGRPFVEAVGPLCESSVWMAEVSAGDGAHPQTGGYEAIADLLIQAGLLAWITGPIATGTPTGHASAQVRGGARV